MARLKRSDIDFRKVFEVLPRVTGLPLERKGMRWYGKCYYSGESHSRVDKTSCRLTPSCDGIQILCQGEDPLEIVTWLVKYGNCKSVYAAYKHLAELTYGHIEIPPPRPEPPLLYVYDDIVNSAKLKIGILRDGLYEGLVSYFVESKVKAAYELYNVCPIQLRDGIGTQFFYTNKDGKTLHDKIILYNGIKRDRNFGGGRKYKVDLGFKGRCLFGEHLLKDYNGQCYCCESEKGAIANYLFTGKLWIASGGLHNLRVDMLPKNVILCPDKDAEHDWSSKVISTGHEIWRWWLDYPQYPCKPKDDITDCFFYLHDKLTQCNQ